MPQAGIRLITKPLLVVIASQVRSPAGDLLARLKMRQHGFDADAFVSWWFVGYMLVRTLATSGQLWVLSKLVLGRALPMFVASSVGFIDAARRHRAERRPYHEDGRWRRSCSRHARGLDAVTQAAHRGPHPRGRRGTPMFE